MHKINVTAKTPRRNEIRMIYPNREVCPPGISLSAQTDEGSNDCLMQKQFEPVQVFCRLRPLLLEDDLCGIILKNPKTVILTTPEQSLDNKQLHQNGIQYIFEHVFDASASQKDVFNVVALPLVENLLKGHNSLLYTYGVSGSGKTYTMAGNIKQRGIMPRCMDVLFHVISDYQAKKYTFKSDHLNGFEILSEDEILLEQEKENKRGRLKSKDSDPEIQSVESCDVSPLDCVVNKHNMYAIFVTYVEVYNNQVYDLLEDRDVQKPSQSRILREDAYRNMFVHGVTEKEITSVEEAIKVFKIGQRRKRIAQTNLNDESSRSHSIFNIRLVQAPTDKAIITISQLSLVDLAGSERSSRTNNKGLRLREAGNINNSLMTLRTCLDYLRENQRNSNVVPKKIPYRDSKITHLFKRYFDGDGKISMIVCVNPNAGDYDENIHVMKFAELTQEVHVARDTPMKVDQTPNRHPANKMFKIDKSNLQEERHFDAEKLNVNVNVNVGRDLKYAFENNIPDYKVDCPEGESPSEELERYLLHRIENRDVLCNNWEAQWDNFRLNFMQMENQIVYVKRELSAVKVAYEKEQERSNSLGNKLRDHENSLKLVNKKLNNRERQIDELTRKLDDQKCLLMQKDQEMGLQKREFELKLTAEVEKRVRVEAKLQDVIKMQGDKLRSLLNTITSTDMPKSMRRSSSFDDLSSMKNINNNNDEVSRAIEHLNPGDLTVLTKANNAPNTDACSVSARACKGLTASNNLHRRSRSSDDKCLEHQSPKPIPLGTVLQSHLKNSKSVTKLTDMKRVTSAVKYMLASHEADTHGDVETKLFKGEIIPTSTGGAQVVFDDVECLKQKSPVSARARKRPITANLSGIVSDASLSTINSTNSATKITSHGSQTAKRPKI